MNKVISVHAANAMLLNSNAEPVPTAATGVKVYQSKRLNVTISIFPTTNPAQVRVQVTKGCTC